MSAAVLDVHGTHSVVWRPGQRGGKLRQHPRSFAALVELRQELDALGGQEVHQLWITPRWLAAHPVSDWPKDDHQRPVAWYPIPGGVSGVAIVAPSQNQRLERYSAASDGQVLAESLELVASSLGTRVEGTPGQTAGKLLLAQLVKRGLVETVPEELPTVLEHPIAWSRELLPHEEELPWLLAVDRRTAYLHSMELAELGTGAPEHVTDTEKQLVIIRAAGYFHCKLRPWGEALLPDPLARPTHGGEWCWLTEPGLRQAIAQSLVLDIDEAWQWPHKSKVLLPVASRIRSALEAASAAPPAVAEVAVPILKAAYQQLHGRLRMPRARSDQHPELFRPDWYATILADSRERSFRMAEALLDADLAPVASVTDCWYVPSKVRELPAVCNPKHWQLKAAVPLAAIGTDAFRDPGTVAQRVNAAARSAEFHRSLIVCQR